MKDPKNITLLLIPYLTICGALYHIAFWDTFAINGLEFITISDIIKSSVYPILSTVFFLIIGALIGIYNNPIEKLLPEGQGHNTSLGRFAKTNYGKFILVIIWILILMFTIKIGTQPERWIVGGVIASLPFSIILDNTGIFYEVFASSKSRIAFCQICVSLPIFSFAIGKYNSELLYKNITYKYTVIKENEKKSKIPTFDTVKFLGATDKHFIFSDLKNSKIYFLRTEKLDTLVFQNK